jgi:hypothetical protein
MKGITSQEADSAVPVFKVEEDIIVKIDAAASAVMSRAG